ncbi:secretin N-terminal domain-containing protein [Sinimarinibacterium flocculans]|uniref:secretin N-terminal domain-containing protein n=1 Tax=Sinimarinibacterium flocculans TaxID=985250 RepID=UPI0035183649
MSVFSSDALLRKAAIVIAALLAVSGCASDRLHRDGLQLLAGGQSEEGLALLAQAAEQSPGNPRFRMDWVVQRERLVREWLVDAKAHQDAERWDQAEAAYQRVQSVEPANARAAEGLAQVGRQRRHAPLLAQAEAAVEAGDLVVAMEYAASVQAEDRRNPRLRNLLRRIGEAQVRDLNAGPELAIPNPEPVSLRYQDASVRSIFDALSRMCGISVVFDRDVQADLRTSIAIEGVTPEAAIDLLLRIAQLRRKILDSETVLIYPDSAEKVRQYEELMIRGFYLGNTDAKQAEALLRTMLKAENIHVDERLNLLVMRDTPDAIRLAEKLIAMQDVQEPEVMLEVAVMEVQRTRLTELGIDWPDAVTVTPLNPSGGTGTSWSDLRALNSERIDVDAGSAVVNLRRELSDSNLLANPRIRARNRESANILIGDRVPVLTSTSTSTGFVSENVQYLDVGLKLNVEPSVYLSDEVAIKVGLEVSSIVREIRTNSGALTYQIGTRSAETVLRLKDGETQILAGLINDEDRASARRVPGIGDLPILSRLFGSKQDSRNKTEIILSITPRVLRNIEPPDSVDRIFWSGTGSRPEVRPLPMQRSSAEAAAAQSGTDAAIAPAEADAVKE